MRKHTKKTVAVRLALPVKIHAELKSRAAKQQMPLAVMIEGIINYAVLCK